MLNLTTDYTYTYYAVKYYFRIIVWKFEFLISTFYIVYPIESIDTNSTL